jgi:ATP-dependent DNA helicase RecG
MAIKENGSDILCLKVLPGRSTPYYYKADGVKESYIRIGNESIIAPDHILNELILKGTNRSFDAMITDELRSAAVPGSAPT